MTTEVDLSPAGSIRITFPRAWIIANPEQFAEDLARFVRVYREGYSLTAKWTETAFIFAAMRVQP